MTIESAYNTCKHLNKEYNCAINCLNAKIEQGILESVSVVTCRSLTVHSYANIQAHINDNDKS